MDIVAICCAAVLRDFSAYTLCESQPDDAPMLPSYWASSSPLSFLPPIRAALTAEAVAAYFAHYVRGRVERFAWPGLNAVNFVLHAALGGGGMASLRHDPQGKALAQALMDFPIPVPALWLEPGGVLAAYAGEAKTL